MPHLSTRKYSSFFSRFAGLVAILILFFSQAAFSQNAITYPLTLKNQTQIKITKIILIPHGLVQNHTSMNLAPGEVVTLLRPECDKLKIEILHENGTFSFPFINFENRKNTAFTLMLGQDTIPVLQFTDKKKDFVTGDNSDWSFQQILGQLPFHIGVTTIEKAKSLGAVATKKENQLETKLFWKNRLWDVLMVFNGNASNSLLTYLEFKTKGVRGETPSKVNEALMSHDYVYYRTTLKNTKMELYVSIPLARALEKANMNGEDLTPVLISHYNEIVVQSFPKKGFWHITMTLAPDLIKNNN